VSQTRKPCPGCGNTFLRDDLLCRRCQDYLKAGQEAEARSRAKGAELGDASFIAIQVPDPDQKELAGFELLPEGMDWKAPEAEELIRALCRVLTSIMPQPEALPTTPYKHGGHFRSIEQAPALPLPADLNQVQAWY